MSNSTPKIEFENVQKVYPPVKKSGEPVEAIGDLSLALEESEIFSIVGPTGCGKSTALNMIAGFEYPSAGALTLDGMPIANPGPDRAVVFQHQSLFPWLTALDNVTLGVKCRGMPKSEYMAKARELLNAVGLSGFEKSYPYQLSGGMQQRVQIARALISSPSVLLMDEPFGALDYQTRLLMQQLLLELWIEFRPTIFFITHDVTEAVFISDRVGVMTQRPGRLKTVADVPIAKPRTIDTLTDSQFTEIEHRVLTSVQEEIGTIGLGASNSDRRTT
ncbi:ABC transporter ATP-binding protein [Aquisalimonas lutea]|uniref:ABC transporter ATP-binding protein n=1 Tax=Aquisalimonas lutea TaxID=1327750 RepID=UPI0025B50CD4|nr:ABC transporter ATP-binding protein [Aquisalimonas lutea]MDN3519801.1 ABC transporter ATP-binding protein [Aquisalimonas lutea]